MYRWAFDSDMQSPLFEIWRSWFSPLEVTAWRNSRREVCRAIDWQWTAQRPNEKIPSLNELFFPSVITCSWIACFFYSFQPFVYPVKHISCFCSSWMRYFCVFKVGSALAIASTALKMTLGPIKLLSFNDGSFGSAQNLDFGSCACMFVVCVCQWEQAEMCWQTSVWVPYLQYAVLVHTTKTICKRTCSSRLLKEIL